MTSHIIYPLSKKAKAFEELPSRVYYSYEIYMGDNSSLNRPFFCYAN